LNEGLAHQTLLGVTGSGKSVGYEDSILIAEVVGGRRGRVSLRQAPLLTASLRRITRTRGRAAVPNATLRQAPRT
jgi:hypothetical protein